jgi:hypothetical protein
MHGAWAEAYDPQAAICEIRQREYKSKHRDPVDRLCRGYVGLLTNGSKGVHPAKYAIAPS